MLALLLLLPAALPSALAEEPAAAAVPESSPEEMPAEEAPAEEAPAEEAPAEEAPAEEDGWIPLSAPADFGSALGEPGDGGMQPEADTGSLVDLLPSHLQLLGKVPQLRGRWALRPLLGVAGLDRSWGGQAGAAVSHQWWSLQESTVRPVGETRLSATAPFGAVQGWDLDLESTHGAWLGPLGLLAGPALRAGARHDAETEAASALSLGPQARLALRLGPVVPWAACTPLWHLASGRAPLPDAPWDAAVLSSGLALDTRPVGLRLSTEWDRTTAQTGTEAAAVTLWSATLGIHLRLL